MAGLVPAIHASLISLIHRPRQDVDARHKAGHDGMRIVDIRETAVPLNSTLANSSIISPR
jgi:hypothetical protein